jgi:hypothetical protein
MGLFSKLADRRRERQQREAEEDARWRAEEEARLQAEEEARRRAEEAMPSPFAGLPFGSLFEQMMFGGGDWTRSLEFDPRTGEWIDTSDAVPEPPAEHHAQEQEARREQPRPARGARRAGGPARGRPLPRTRSRRCSEVGWAAGTRAAGATSTCSRPTS